MGGTNAQMYVGIQEGKATCMSVREREAEVL